MYDCTDPTSPLVGLPEDTQQELLGRLKALLVVRAQTVDHAEVESLAYKLSAAYAATERGRMYLGRFYTGLRNAVEVRLKMTGWLYRNIRWWVLYFEGGEPVESICPHALAVPHGASVFTLPSPGCRCQGTATLFTV
jgi:hypothetical protein